MNTSTVRRPLSEGKSSNRSSHLAEPKPHTQERGHDSYVSMLRRHTAVLMQRFQLGNCTIQASAAWQAQAAGLAVQPPLPRCGEDEYDSRRHDGLFTSVWGSEANLLCPCDCQLEYAA